ncbi:HNH endonuclease [Cohnella massiliensis]|uniref:HNH endonuclease n=1 Tax=Cohnella massiliensis TaxID=1816691 RepID=UPI0009BB3F26|nr:HNH endonuclease [Cohnella massiliensis]
MSLKGQYEVIASQKDWVPINNLIRIREGMTLKQIRMAELNNGKRIISHGVVRMVYQNIVLFVQYLEGKVYKFNTNVYKEITDCEGDRIILEDIKTGEQRIVFEKGIFYPTEGEFLLHSYERSGGNCDKPHDSYPSIKLGSREEGHFVPRLHQIVAMLGYGEIALYALGEKGRKYDINHIDRNHDNFRLDNLEITTLSGNNKHGHLVREGKSATYVRYEKRVKELLGV